MKLITANSGSSKIEVYNSIWGKETIKVNDKVVSSKFSIIGAVHEFKAIEDNEQIHYEVKIKFGFGPAVDILRQGRPLLKFPKYGAIRFMVLLVICLTIAKLIS